MTINTNLNFNAASILETYSFASSKIMVNLPQVSNSSDLDLKDDDAHVGHDGRDNLEELDDRIVTLEKVNGKEIDFKSGKEEGKNNKDLHGDDYEVTRFMKGCEEGNEDKENCESFMNWLKEKEKFKIDQRKTKDDRKMFTRGIRKDEGEVTSFIKGCEEGNEDKENCESFMNWLKEKEKFKIDQRKTKDDRKMFTRGIRKDEGEVTSFIKGCEEGNEDKENCESFMNWLKEKEKFKIDQRKTKDDRKMFTRGIHKDEGEVTSFIKGCEEGNEDKEIVNRS